MSCKLQGVGCLLKFAGVAEAWDINSHHEGPRPQRVLDVFRVLGGLAIERPA